MWGFAVVVRSYCGVSAAEEGGAKEHTWSICVWQLGFAL
jgi:hypothetical protein